ncbi:MAG: transposase [Spirochaetaceae bacterium]|nr:transposase [Spirochaetaceae bacterium]
MLYSLKSQELWGGEYGAGTSFNREEEFAGLDFHSVRLEERFVRTMETLTKQPGASIWEASENRAEAKAIYRMLGNERFDREEPAGVPGISRVNRWVTFSPWGGDFLFRFYPLRASYTAAFSAIIDW